MAPLPSRVHAAGYEQCQGKLLRLLERLVYLREVTADYTYYGIASPWLQVCTQQQRQYGCIGVIQLGHVCGFPAALHFIYPTKDSRSQL